MAFVILTDVQKQALVGSNSFKVAAHWSIFDKASYWQGLDGANVPNNDRVLWAKNRKLSAQMNSNPNLVVGDADISQEFVVACKNYLLWDSEVEWTGSEEDFQLIISRLKNYSGTNLFDVLADSYFVSKVDNVF